MIIGLIIWPVLCIVLLVGIALLTQVALMIILTNDCFQREDDAMRTRPNKSIFYKFSACSKRAHRDCPGAAIVRKSDDMGKYEQPARCNCECHQPALFGQVERTQRDLF